MSFLLTGLNRLVTEK